MKKVFALFAVFFVAAIILPIQEAGHGRKIDFSRAWAGRIEECERQIAALEARVNGLEREQELEIIPESVSDLYSLREFVLRNFPEAREWRDGSASKELARRIREGLVSAYENISAPWPDAYARHYGSFMIRYYPLRPIRIETIDFVFDIDGPGVFFEKLQWLVVEAIAE